MIYLDNAATTPVSSSVLAAALPYFSEKYGNPGSMHAAGREAANAVSKAREQVAALFHTTPEHVIFTSGGSEGNSMVLRNGFMRAIISDGEHHSILAAAEHIPQPQAEAGLLPNGTVDLDALKNTKVVGSHFPTVCSIMYVNNETGAVNDVEAISRWCRENNLWYHCDCVQAVGVRDLDMPRLGCDSASISAHKFHGFKGAGALYVKDPERLLPLIHGGDVQEFGLRGGTENVPGIVAMGQAAQDVLDHIATPFPPYKRLLYDALRGRLAGLLYNADTILTVNGPDVDEPGRILSLQIKGIDAQTLLLLLSANGVCVSAGSACNASSSEPSHVLRAMGLTDEEISSTIRISFSEENTSDEAVRAGEIIGGCIHALFSTMF